MIHHPHTADNPVVACPKCRHVFPLTKALTGPIEAEVAKRLEADYEERVKEQSQEVQRRVKQAEAKALEKAKAEQAVEVKSLREQVAEQQATIVKGQRDELALRKRTRDLEDREKSLALEVERRLAESAQGVEEAAIKRTQEHHRLKEQEKEKQLADARRQVDELTRKLQQGSQQVQGEVAEVDLEEQLCQAFKLDKFEPTATGQRGADLLQRVVDLRGQVVGTIIWERKNAKNFADTWPPKLREDQRDNHAEVAVLVTPVLPKGIALFGQHAAVWVAKPEVAMALASALRSALIDLARARSVAEGQVEKHSILFDYVSGTEFRQRVEAMLDPLLALITDFDKERRANAANWARRQKQHEAIMRGMVGLWGDFSGIVGTLPAPKQLHLEPGKEGAAEAA